MSYLTIPTGSPLSLNLQLFDGATNQYPLAHVYDAVAETEVSGSPFALSHFANGLYLNTAYTPSAGRYYAVYITYLDSGHATENVTYTREEDYFQVDPTVAQIATILSDVADLDLSSDPTAIAAAVWNSNKSAFETPGTFGYANSGDLTEALAALLPNLAYLDIAVSSRSSQASVSAGFSTVAQASTTATQALLTSVYELLGTPHGASISADIAAIKADTSSIEATVETTGAIVSEISIENIAAAVWDETLSAHVQMGSTGQQLSLIPLTSGGGGGGGGITPTDIADIAFAVWDEPLISHNTAGTVGAVENILANFNPDRIANLDNLDAAVSSRNSTVNANANSVTELAAIAAAAAVTNAINSLVETISTRIGIPVTTVSGDIAEIATDVDAIETKTAALPIDPASQSAVLAPLTDILDDILAVQSTANAINAKTTNLPAIPANEASVLAIPTTPLLSSDSRLTNLDAAISSRATPADLATLATAAGLATLQTTITTEISAVLAALLPLATTAQINAAVAPLATQILLQSVQTAVNSIAASALDASQVWNYGIRTLTAPVDTTLDISGLATAVQLAATQAAIIAALPKSECQAVIAIDPVADVLTAEAWMIQDGSPLTDRTSCSINVYNSAGSLIFTMGPNTSPSSQGVFTLVYNSASAVIIRNKAYVAQISITNGVTTKMSLQTFTVF